MDRFSAGLFLAIVVLLMVCVPSTNDAEAMQSLSLGCTAMNSAFFAGTYSAHIVMSVFDFTANKVITIQAGPPDTGAPTTIALWFDGVLVASAPYSAGSLVYVISADVSGINEIAVRVNLGTSATFTVSCDYVPPPAPEPGCDAWISIPTSSAGGLFVADAPVYWKPGMLAQPLVTIKAGNTARVTRSDSTGVYFEILWQCQFVWTPADTLAPNPDAVWRGAPLPPRPRVLPASGNQSSPLPTGARYGLPTGMTFPVYGAPVTASTYTVKAGDNLFRIALHFGVDLYRLARVNGITDVGRIYVGQVLDIASAR